MPPVMSKDLFHPLAPRHAMPSFRPRRNNGSIHKRRRFDSPVITDEYSVCAGVAAHPEKAAPCENVRRWECVHGAARADFPPALLTCRRNFVQEELFGRSCRSRRLLRPLSALFARLLRRAFLGLDDPDPDLGKPVDAVPVSPSAVFAKNCQPLCTGERAALAHQT